MTLLRQGKETSALRDDVERHLDEYIRLLGMKCDLMHDSGKILASITSPLPSDDIDSLLGINSEIVSSIDLIESHIASLKDGLSRITGIDDTEKALHKIMTEGKKQKQVSGILHDIQSRAEINYRLLSSITSLLEMREKKEQKDIDALMRIEKLRGRFYIKQ